MLAEICEKKSQQSFAIFFQDHSTYIVTFLSPGDPEAEEMTTHQFQEFEATPDRTQVVAENFLRLANNFQLTIPQTSTSWTL